MANVPTTDARFGRIQTEAGGSNPISLSEYYSNSSFVAAGGGATAAGTYGAIPASGAISVGSFRNKFFFKDTISASTAAGYNVMTEAAAAGFLPASQTLIAVITVNAAVVLSAPSTAGYAFQTGTGFTSGATIHLVNNGTIAGRGGAGGTGGGSNAGGSTAATAASAGGHAINAQVALRVTNNGTVGGGGGGGGGGASRYLNDGKQTYSASGGGGGGGRSTGALGVRGTASGTSFVYNNGANGTAGTATTAGSGGGGSSGSGLTGGTGGAGGALGSAGSSGGTGSGGSSAGGHTAVGATGNYAVNNANISWLVTGTRLGGVS